MGTWGMLTIYQSILGTGADLSPLGKHGDVLSINLLLKAKQLPPPLCLPPSL